MAITLPHRACDRIPSQPIPLTQSHHRSQIKRRQAALRHRRRLVYAKATFQSELNQALSVQTQSNLGIKIQLDGQFLDRPGFVAGASSGWGSRKLGPSSPDRTGIQTVD